ncbi:MAG: response regulator [Chloroflexota bacterium]
MKVLVADDDRAIGLALRMTLEDLGHECLVAEDGVAALKLFEEHGADAIISDWRMPGLEGPALCRRVRSHTQEQPSTPYVYFILLTVLSEPRHVLAGMEAGADDFLTKPFTVDTLQARLIAAERVTHLHRSLARRQTEYLRLADERQELIEQLGRERSQLQTILQQMPAGVVIAAAPSGEILMTNNLVSTILREEDIAAAVRAGVTWQGIHPDGHVYQPHEWPLMRSLSTGEIVAGEEVDLVWSDDLRRTVRISSAPISEHEQIVAAVCVLHDITEERRHQRQTAQADKLRALGQLAGGVAHDLNQSLTLVIGYAELIREALQTPESRDTAGTTEMLRLIIQAAHDGGETVKRLLTFSRAPENSPAELVDVSTLLDDVAKLTAPRWRDDTQAEGRPVTLQVTAEAGTTILGWAGALREALTNLIFNAVDALPAGGTIALRALTSPTHVTIEVQDSGVGIPLEIQERIFEPFFTTRGEQGTGLGLPMVFGIVERHQGQTLVESVPSVGTSVRLTFPRPTIQTAQEPRPPSTASTPRQILIVDDHPGIRQMVTRILAEHGHGTVQVASAEEALIELERQAFDLMLTDVGLGEGMNGWQLAAEARKRWPAMHVILATGWAAGLDQEAARELGIAQILGKPYRSADLVRAIAAL